MAKIFTIAEGLENLGALKSGGQGSVYKARKTGEIITAIKILPTPIASENDDDKHFISFQNEVQKLKRVNEVPNPNVVSIIASGITSSGNLPFIEMEYIEGPDLGELLQPPYDPVFSVKEVLKVADHLANALAHCHRAHIKHGDIKSNNVKFNQRTGNYVLLDFGLSVMSDEQRRTSIRYAGAVEFMAPEQSTGETLTETDVYSYGVVLFELLTGNVPFPLGNKGEMARNAVMLAHMEKLPPDIITLRRNALPADWSADKQQREMEIPVWLLSMIYKCLEKDPANRFTNGCELQEFIQRGTISDERKKAVDTILAQPVKPAADELALRKELVVLQAALAKKENLVKDLQYLVETRDRELIEAQRSLAATRNGVSKSFFFLVFIVALGLGGYAAYDKLLKPGNNVPPPTITNVDNNKLEANRDPATTPAVTPASDKTIKEHRRTPPKKPDKPVAHTSHKPAKKNTPVTNKYYRRHSGTYAILKDTYFYDAPDTNKRSDVYLTAGDATLTLKEENGDFQYAIFIDADGKPIKGWLMKKDFKPETKY
ncbi:serine/threonine protein kinase [Hanamia caeni]|jgi:serine/threonine-protein kinase|uniref:Serine/threonine protein kinase n=1 Tax=Hanamia caeni TaxID=2294116 RepID=A0A3M9N9I7_9BACT|nr:serine/threonine-protein kinase [Hanamia caeni]RNI34055.1 serine/threonine protein kinase [Hanamia caeni]